MTLPGPEAKLAAHDQIIMMLAARIEQLAQDTTSSINALTASVNELQRDMRESFKANVAYQIDQERKIEARFDKVDARFDKVEQRLGSVETKIDEILMYLKKGQ